MKNKLLYLGAVTFVLSMPLFVDMAKPEPTQPSSNWGEWDVWDKWHMWDGGDGSAGNRQFPGAISATARSLIAGITIPPVVESYLRTCARTRCLPTARASASSATAACPSCNAMFHARRSREIPREEPMPNTASGIWVRLAELGNAYLLYDGACGLAEH